MVCVQVGLHKRERVCLLQAKLRAGKPSRGRPGFKRGRVQSFCQRWTVCVQSVFHRCERANLPLDGRVFGLCHVTLQRIISFCRRSMGSVQIVLLERKRGYFPLEGGCMFVARKGRARKPARGESMFETL